MLSIQSHTFSRFTQLINYGKNHQLILCTVGALTGTEEGSN